MSLMNEISIRSKAHSEALEALQASVLGYLSRGLAEGYGFEPPRRLQDSVVPIPAEAWTGKVDWSSSTLMHQSIRFIEIRIMPAHWKDELSSRWHAKYAPARRPRDAAPRAPLD